MTKLQRVVGKAVRSGRLKIFLFGNFARFAKRLAIPVIMAVVMLLSGHGNAHADPGLSQLDNEYIAVLDHFGVPYTTPADAIVMGHGACKELSEGVDPDQVAMDVSQVSGMAPIMGAYLTGAASGAYCPQYKVGT